MSGGNAYLAFVRVRYGKIGLSVTVLRIMHKRIFLFIACMYGIRERVYIVLLENTKLQMMLMGNLF